MSPIHMLAGIQVGHHGFYVDLQIELKCQMVKLRYWREKWTHLVTSHERHGLSNHRLFFQQLVQTKTNENIPWWWESVNNGFPSYIHWCGKRFHVMTSSGPIYHYNPSYTSTQHIMFHTFTEHTVREIMTNVTSCQYGNTNGQFLYANRYIQCCSIWSLRNEYAYGLYGHMRFVIYISTPSFHPFRLNITQQISYMSALYPAQLALNCKN